MVEISLDLKYCKINAFGAKVPSASVYYSFTLEKETRTIPALFMKDFFELKANLKKGLVGYSVLKVALLGDSSTQLLSQALKGMAYECGIDLCLYEADYDQIQQQVLSQNSELFGFQPEVIIICQSSEKLNLEYNALAPDFRSQLAARRLLVIQQLYCAINTRLHSKLIYFNYPEINDGVYGNYATKTESSFLYQLRQLNFELMNYAAKEKNFFICDISSIQSVLGRRSFFHAPGYINGSMVYSLEALPLIAKNVMDIVSALRGQMTKCLVLDLDNTLWGGIVGDDGLENIQIGILGIGKAFTEFQQWLKALHDRGILLAVCSKNLESTAREPFEKHPEMLLRMEHFAVFIANWESKAENIKTIQRTLNIGFDSMVFIDDNPFERAIVRDQVPGIQVPELPEDPAEYLSFLSGLNLFETVSFSQEDLHRNDRYRVEAERQVLAKTIGSESDFLKNLDMEALQEKFTKFNIPRVAQLSQRSNQFNLRTVRYTEEDLTNLTNDPHYFPFAFTLRDRFGDYGLVAVVILRKISNDTLFIDSWFMSCRVLKRGLEEFVLERLVTFSEKEGVRFLKGEYLPTAKNQLVENHYQRLGFTGKNNFWLLDVRNYTTKTTFIRSCQKYEPGTLRTI